MKFIHCEKEVRCFICDTPFNCSTTQLGGHHSHARYCPNCVNAIIRERDTLLLTGKYTSIRAAELDAVHALRAKARQVAS